MTSEQAKIVLAEIRRNELFSIGGSLNPVAVALKALVRDRDDLLAACKAFAELYRSADLDHEDECRRLYGIVSRAIARAESRP